MSIDEDIVIVGAGIAGLATALGLHRMGLRSLILESSDRLTTIGFAITMWTNAWRALDALGVAELLRENSVQYKGFKVVSVGSDQTSSNKPPEADLEHDKIESRCVRRQDLLESMERELPKGTIRYSSKLVSIEESGKYKLLHLADGSFVKTKVLIGCDGGNSMVAKWLGLENPIERGRSVIRGFVTYPDGHGFEPKFHMYLGGGASFGIVPCNEKSIYWFCNTNTLVLTTTYDGEEESPLKLKQFVESKVLINAPIQVRDVVVRTALDSIACTALKFRSPLNILLGNIEKNNVCVAGDAFHPMTPDIGQGGCSSLEDGVVLARCLGEALLNRENKEEYVEIEKGLKRYVKERRWRSFCLTSSALVIGWIHQSDDKIISFLRKRFLGKYTVGATMKLQNFDCGKLIVH